MRPAIAFHTSRLVFKAIDATDESKEGIREINSDPEVYLRSSMDVPRPYALARADTMIEAATKAHVGVFICLPKSPAEPTVPGEILGFLILGKNPPSMDAHRVAHFGITLKAGCQGKGYGGEALEWLLDMAFMRFGLHKVEGGTWGWNEPARKLYKRMGFVEEGIKRKQLWQEGAWQDLVILGILDEEWAEWKKLKNNPA